jgi:hypothetical protein
MMRPLSRAFAALLLGIPFAPLLAGVVPRNDVFGAALLSAAAIGAPGVAGVLYPGGMRAPHLAVRFLAGAFLLNLAALITRRAAGIEATPASYAAILGAWTVLAGAAGLLRNGRLPSFHPATAALGGAAFLLAFVAGARIIPPLEDQDMEAQGTAYGLVANLEPLCLTNRSTLYFFAHPPLLHFFNAATLTLSGEIEKVRAAYDAAFLEREKLPLERRRPGWSRVVEAFADPARTDYSLLWNRRVYPEFLKEPALFGTRAPNFMLAAILAMLMFCALRSVGTRAGDSAFLTLVTMTLPEIFVRSGYGGYFAISAATFLCAAWLAVLPAPRPAFLAGFLALLANQKSVIVGAAALLHGARRARPLLLGLLAGALAFAIYGLWVAPEDYVADHILDHGLRRFDAAESHPGRGAPAYPSRAGLWIEFAQHFGWVWCATAAAAWGAALAALILRRRRREPAAEEDDLREIAALWILVGAAIFTATDWRQTKHLCKLVPAMTLVIGALLARSPRPLRAALRAALVVSFLWNVRWLVKIAQDFSSFPMSTMW